MSRYVTVSTVTGGCPRYDEKPELNDAVDMMIEYWQKRLETILPDKPDLILLPEASDRYIQLSNEEKSEYISVKKSRIRDFWMSVAKENSCYIAYSAARELEDGSRRNSTQIIDRNGKIAGIYNKNNVMTGETTNNRIFPGKSAPVIQCDFGTVACAICFDINFDEPWKTYAREKPDIILYSSVYHGGIMQNYRAYSCRAHLVSSIWGLPSAITLPTGDVLATTTNYFNWVTAKINLDCCLIHYDYNWDKILAIKDKYGKKVNIHNPGLLGVFLISVESDEFDIRHIIGEFELDLVDDHFKNALEHNRKYARD